MDRRQFLAAGVGGAALLAGCYEGSDDDEEDPTATETATPTPTPTPLALGIAGVSEGTDGALVATVEVVNQSEAERTGTIELTARAGEDRQTVTREVTVPAGETATVALTFSALTREAFSQDGSFPTATVTT